MPMGQQLTSGTTGWQDGERARPKGWQRDHGMAGRGQGKTKGMTAGPQDGRTGRGQDQRDDSGTMGRQDGERARPKGWQRDHRMAGRGEGKTKGMTAGPRDGRTGRGQDQRDDSGTTGWQDGESARPKGWHYNSCIGKLHHLPNLNDCWGLYAASLIRWFLTNTEAESHAWLHVFACASYDLESHNYRGWVLDRHQPTSYDAVSWFASENISWRARSVNGRYKRQEFRHSLTHGKTANLMQ